MLLIKRSHYTSKGRKGVAGKRKEWRKEQELSEQAKGRKRTARAQNSNTL